MANKILNYIATIVQNSQDRKRDAYHSMLQSGNFSLAAYRRERIKGFITLKRKKD